MPKESEDRIMLTNYWNYEFYDPVDLMNEHIRKLKEAIKETNMKTWENETQPKEN
jgi:hypothetical protein